MGLAVGEAGEMEMIVGVEAERLTVKVKVLDWPPSGLSALMV